MLHVGRQMKIGYAYPLSRLSAHYLPRGYKKIASKNFIVLHITNLNFKEKPIRLEHGPRKNPKFFSSPALSTLHFEKCRCVCYNFFCYFNFFSQQTFLKNHFKYKKFKFINQQWNQSTTTFYVVLKNVTSFEEWNGHLNVSFFVFLH